MMQTLLLSLNLLRMLTNPAMCSNFIRPLTGKGGSAKAAERIIDGLSKVNGNLIDVFTQIECANYFAAEFDAD